MMKPRPAPAAVALCSVAVAACAYYNGLYNANRLASDAQRAQREGRIGEARSLWSQVAVKAESVAARYPGSRYHDDALLLQGRALHANGECNRATAPLEEALRSSPDSDIQEAAALTLGQCSFVLGDFLRAIDVLGPLTEVSDSTVSRPGRLWRGRSLLALGSYREAAADLELADRRKAAYDLSIAYTLLGRSAYARFELERVLADPYVERHWLKALGTLGLSQPEDAAEIVALLVERSDLTDPERSQLLLDDGRRWAALGREPEAEARFRRAVELAPDSPPGRAALLELTLIGVRRADDLARLPQLADSLMDAATAIGNGQSSAVRLATLLRGAATAVMGSDQPTSDSLAARHPDLEMFLRAEDVRDVVGAPRLATAMFLALVERFPDSPIAPKALIAAAQLDPIRSDSLLLVLHVRYTGSPYTLLLNGAARDRYAALEDSLRTLIATLPRPQPREN